MVERKCPWWLGYLLASPIRRWVQGPPDFVRSYVKPGMTVFEPGPGMGFFTIELAKDVGPAGRVVAVDVQSRMISGLKRRLAKAGVAKQVDARLSSETSLGLSDLTGKVDFTLAMTANYTI